MLLTMLQPPSDGPPPGASVLHLYYENLKKCELEKAQSRSSGSGLADMAHVACVIGAIPLFSLAFACRVDPGLCIRYIIDRQASCMDNVVYVSKAWAERGY